MARFRLGLIGSHEPFVRKALGRAAIVAGLSVLAACGDVWNDPYPADQRGANVLYSAFSERPKHLDPQVAYTEDEYTFISQIYEPPLQYHYLKRPYELIPATLVAMPKVTEYDAAGRVLPPGSEAAKVARTVYELAIRPGIRYQPHPAFNGRLPDASAIARASTAAELGPPSSRELVADDYIYSIKRLVHPRLHSPIGGMMAEHIVGLKELSEALAQGAKTTPGWIDLDAYPLSGVEKVDAHTFRIALKGKYPQFLYWLAMPFFAPVSRDVERFYAQPGMAEKNLTLDWHPVGTGPYMLTENNPNSRMVLTRNPNFHGEAYPTEGEPADREAGLLEDAGKPMPFIDRAVFTREKEAIPYWNKFLQGYYDASGISSDSFDQAVRVGSGGDVTLTDEMREKGIRLLTSVRASTYYMGFNMADPVVGGLDEKRRKLRQAISMAIDQEEFITIFMNGRGVAAMGPLPPGIFGFEEGREGLNTQLYDWDEKAGQPRRKGIAVARALLAEAGYPNGRHEKTGEPLVVNLDTTGGGMGDKARLDWLTRQLARIDVQLVVRSTDFNRFQEKLRKGAQQIFYLGWNADYPDPENFFFLLYGKEATLKGGGENKSNYENPEFDRLFERTKNMDNTPARLALIRQMTRILQRDAPWSFGFFPKSYALGHVWLKNRKPNNIANNTLKYQRVDFATRQRLRDEWNSPVRWPLVALAALAVLIVGPAVIAWRRRERQIAR
jgi:ABC-type transport system substrate-binding protein